MIDKPDKTFTTTDDAEIARLAESMRSNEPIIVRDMRGYVIDIRHVTDDIYRVTVRQA